VAVIDADGSAGAFTDGDNRGHMLTQLGFAIPEEFTTRRRVLLRRDQRRAARAPRHRPAGLHVVPGVGAADDRRPPLVQGLSAIAEGRNVFLDDITAGAMSFSSTLSIPHALDLLVPQIEQALAAE
jgi:iron complex transport system substrate-binding protein